jgi:2-dehydro-3-deoxygluconokinase
VSGAQIVALGETMLSLVATGSLAETSTLLVTHGGAESNTCVGLARLGLTAEWVGRLGTDTVGERVLTALASEGVVLEHVRRDAERPTGIMLRDTTGTVRYDRAGSAASRTSPEDLDDAPVAGAAAVLVTGVTALIGAEPQRAAVALLERASGLRVVDPHVRLGLWGSERAVELVSPLVRLADLVLGGPAELAALVGPGEPRDLAGRCRDLGPREVVVKLAREGAGAMDAAGRWFEHAGTPVPNVDPVGAGDAFNAGYLAARLSGRTPAESLAQGASCGAAVASTVGDTEGFPRGDPVAH